MPFYLIDLFDFKCYLCCLNPISKSTHARYVIHMDTLCLCVYIFGLNNLSVIYGNYGKILF